jgi:hypothetical protein
MVDFLSWVIVAGGFVGDREQATTKAKAMIQSLRALGFAPAPPLRSGQSGSLCAAGKRDVARLEVKVNDSLAVRGV